MVRRVLAVILGVWEPLNLALFVAPRLFSILSAGDPAPVVFLGARLLIAALGVAAGVALWTDRPHGRALAATALVLSTIAAAITFLTPLLPTNVMPGDEWFWLGLVVAFNGGWLVYLRLTADSDHEHHEDH